MQDLKLIEEYKWNQGFYSFQDLLILVKYKIMTPQQFFNVTKYHYDDVKEKTGDT